jgi:hypothetical protein
VFGHAADLAGEVWADIVAAFFDLGAQALEDGAHFVWHGGRSWFDWGGDGDLFFGQCRLGGRGGAGADVGGHQGAADGRAGADRAVELPEAGLVFEALAVPEPAIEFVAVTAP